MIEEEREVVVPQERRRRSWWCEEQGDHNVVVADSPGLAAPVMGHGGLTYLRVWYCHELMIDGEEEGKIGTLICFKQWVNLTISWV